MSEQRAGDGVEGARLEAPQTRREFLKRAGLGSALLAGGGAFAGLGASARAATYGRNQRAKVGGEVSIRYWGVGPERTAWDNRLKYFKSKYPNVTVKAQLLTKNGYEEFPGLLAQIAAGKAPDVIRVLNFQPTQLVAQGNALMPLDDFIKGDKTFNQADFVEAAWVGATVDGKVYCIPQNGEPYNLFWNKAAFTKLGLPDPYKLFKQGKLTQETYEGWVQQLVQKGGFKYGTAFEAWNYDVFIFMGGGRILDDKLNVVIDKGDSPKALQVFADWVDNKLAPNPQVIGGTAFQLFANQQIGTFISGSWWAKYLPPVVQNKFPWGTSGLPKILGHAGSKLEIDSLSISSGTKNPEAAWALVRTLTDTKGLVLWSLIATPTRKSALRSKEFLANPHVRAVIDMTKVSSITPFTKAGAAVDTAAMTALATMWLGKKTAAEATKDAAKKIAEAIA